MKLKNRIVFGIALLMISYLWVIKIDRKIEKNESTSEWTSNRKNMWRKGSSIFFINSVEIEDPIEEAVCIKASIINGKIKMLRYIKDNISIREFLKKGHIEHNMYYRALYIYLAKKGILNDARVEDNQLKRIVMINKNGKKIQKLRCKTILKIDSKSLRKQLYAPIEGIYGHDTRIKIKIHI